MSDSRRNSGKREYINYDQRRARKVHRIKRERELDELLDEEENHAQPNGEEEDQ